APARADPGDLRAAEGLRSTDTEKTLSTAGSRSSVGLPSRPYQANTSKPPQSPGRTGWPDSRIPQAAGRGGQAAHGGLKAPTWAMIAATSSAAHSSLILPSVTR